MTALPELLAPAGDAESLKAAVRGGADAVYFGTDRFNARMNAKNFDRRSTREAIDHCHSKGVRTYITVNTQLFDREIALALERIAQLRADGVDALICADTGLCREIRRNFPDLPIHASTQMSLCDTDGVKFASEMGFSRAVVARELTFDDIKKIAESSPIEIEIFVHGALCVCVSGQCLMSSFIGGRSGNRGECAQPCRMEYSPDGGRKKDYLLSLKDMCLAGHITELIESGAASLKIEGRMRSPSYVYGVVSTYRRLLDERRNADKKDIEFLASLFSRNGFTDGYFTGRISDNMNGMRSPSDKTPSVKQTDLSRKGCITYDRKENIPKLSEAGEPVMQKKVRSARFSLPEQIPDGVKGDFFDIKYLPLEKFEPSKANGVILPPVCFDREHEHMKMLLEKAASDGAEHIMICNPGQIGLAREYSDKVSLHLDFRFNADNSFTAKELIDRTGADDIILSPELALPQIRDIRVCQRAVIVYGRLPLMLFHKRLKTKSITDRTGAEFPILTEWGRSVLHNSAVTYTADTEKELRAAYVFNRHFIFTCESPAEVKRIIQAYELHAPAGGKFNFRRLPKIKKGQ